MGIFDFIKSELIDIIEWLQNSSTDTMVYRFERKDNEIKNGAKLIVRESQCAIFINEGKLADVFGPGTYSLTTQNVPILSTLKGWKYGFDSPFKAEVYFVSTKQFTDQKWGTPNPITLRDADFGMVRIRAFGNYSYKITDPVKFLTEIVATNWEFTTEQIAGQLRTMIISRFTDAVAESKMPVLDIATKYDELSAFCQQKLGVEFKNYGFDMTSFLIANISLPPEVEAAIDKRSSMGALGVNYQQMQTADAMKAAAENEGAGGGMNGMMGMMMMQNMMNQQQQNQNPYGQQQNPYGQQMNNQVAPPPPPVMGFHISVNGQQQGPIDMNTLRNMTAQGQFTKQTYVWKAGMAGWLPAEQVAELAPLFQTMAPPPPPPPPM